jgi:hypothetical protein
LAGKLVGRRLSHKVGGAVEPATLPDWSKKADFDFVSGVTWFEASSERSH